MQQAFLQISNCSKCSVLVIWSFPRQAEKRPSSPLSVRSYLRLRVCNMKKLRCRNNAGTTWHFLLEKLQAQRCCWSTAPPMFLLCWKPFQPFWEYKHYKRFKNRRISEKPQDKPWNTEARPAGKAGKELVAVWLRCRSKVFVYWKILDHIVTYCNMIWLINCRNDVKWENRCTQICLAGPHHPRPMHHFSVLCASLRCEFHDEVSCIITVSNNVINC